MKTTGTSQECYAKKHDKCPLIDFYMGLEISCQCKCHQVDRLIRAGTEQYKNLLERLERLEN